MAEFLRNPTPDDVKRWMQQGESQTVEFKGFVPSVLSLAQNISAMANGEGGALLIGIQEHPPRVTGITWQQVSGVFERAMANLTPMPNAIFHQVTMPDGKIVGVVSVARSQNIVVSPHGAYIRHGDRLVSMTPDEVKARIATQDGGIDTAGLAEGFSKLIETTEHLRNEVRSAQSFRGQLRGYLIGFLLGILASMIANKLSCNPNPVSTHYEPTPAVTPVGSPSATSAPTSVPAPPVVPAPSSAPTPASTYTPARLSPATSRTAQPELPASPPTSAPTTAPAAP